MPTRFFVLHPTTTIYNSLRVVVLCMHPPHMVISVSNDAPSPNPFSVTPRYPALAEPTMMSWYLTTLLLQSKMRSFHCLILSSRHSDPNQVLILNSSFKSGSDILGSHQLNKPKYFLGFIGS